VHFPPQNTKKLPLLCNDCKEAVAEWTEDGAGIFDPPWIRLWDSAALPTLLARIPPAERRAPS
jgi:hypothetical protein